MSADPRTLAELESRFPIEEACRDYLFALRWPDSFRCPRCSGAKAWPMDPRSYQCAGCSYQATVTTGTIFHRTRIPLTVWFRAMWWVVPQKSGAITLGFKRVLGLGSYETAWTWPYRLRRAMVRPDSSHLNGQGEVGETLFGGLEEGASERRTFKKALVAIAAEEDGRGIGRIRLKGIPDASAKSLHGFILEAVQTGSTVHTDDWLGYTGIGAKGYVWEVTTIGGDHKQAARHFHRVHKVASLLKRWILGTHQGAVSPQHPEYYLDEFVFRFNRRRSNSRGKLFYRLVQQAVATGPVPYEKLVKHIRGPKPQAPKRYR